MIDVFRSTKKKLDLKNVTCVLIDGVEPNFSANTLTQCQCLCNFYDVILFSYKEPTVAFEGTFIKIPKLTFVEYNKFLSLELYKYIKSDYCLVTQTDGFILNEKAWTNEFYKYDYIGAPWYVYDLPEDEYVGNGGFSLRSKKYLETCAKLPYDGTVIEDVYYSIKNKHFMREQGIKVAPHQLASKFSVEGQEYTGQFGFHGKCTVVYNFYKDIDCNIWRKLKGDMLFNDEIDDILFVTLFRDKSKKEILENVRRSGFFLTHWLDAFFAYKIVEENTLLTYEKNTWKHLFKKQEEIITALENKNIELQNQIKKICNK